VSAEPRFARCPAKVNLALRVVGRREDGYHELDTVFQAIDLWDRIEIRADRELKLSCNNPALPTDAGNLVWRAAELVRRRARRSVGADLRLVKSIPLQAGLGGGSSDAAGALRLCRDFWEVPLSDAELHEMARQLGADVPFFLVGGTAHGGGRGDRIEAMPFLGELPILLGLPAFGISTAEVFGALAARLTLPRNGVSLRTDFALKWWEDNDFSFAVNELESVVFPRWPELERFRDALLGAGARRGLLSGSGSTVFGIFDDAAARDDAARRLPIRFAGWRILSTRAVDEAARVVNPTGG
jgi:4-diphosphocytidyl-2-C-methyl-D-erythritol kinase